MFYSIDFRSWLSGLGFLLLAGSANLAAQAIHTCTIMAGAEAPATQPVPSNLPLAVHKAVSYKPTGSYQNNLWTPGSTVTVRFLGGSTALRGRVMRYANEWTQYANLNFRVVDYGKADIRVGFTQNGSSWSMVGSSSARASQSSPSMNFGWLTDQTPDAEVRRTVLHEFGHAIGLLHEHQNPAGGIPWDEEAVYAHYYRTQGWDRNTTYHNVMATANQNHTQYSAYDAASIMHYPIDARLTRGNYMVGMNNQLSTTDKLYINRLYPGRQVTTTSRPAPTTPPTTTTPSRPRPSTTTTTPSRPTTTSTRPAAGRHTVRISNQLGKNQQAEIVELYVADRKYVIQLDRNGRMRQELNLALRPGQYRYRVVTKSTYHGYRIVERNGRRYQQTVAHDVPGDGSGVLTVGGDMALTLYGSYDEQQRRMKVYLGASK